MTLSGELSYRIGYDVEHDLFHAQNVFNDEYIKPTFVEYVQKLEKENKVLTQNLEDTEIINNTLEKENAELKEVINNDVDKKIYVQLANKAELADVQKGQLTKAKELLKQWLSLCGFKVEKLAKDTEQFISEVEND